MKKRILSIVLVLSMLMAFMPIITSAETSGVCGYNLTWTLDDNGTLTISGTGDMTDFNYPDYGPWYNSKDSIKAVVIESGVTSIGSEAFKDCSSLESVTIPDGVTSIGDKVFIGCSSLTSVIIPDSVTELGHSMFWTNHNLKRISIGSGVKTIPLGFFGYCRSLTSVTIPDSVTSIGKKVFIGCSSLTSIIIIKETQIC